MIATLFGKVAEKLGGLVVIDVQGVGYGVLVSLEDSGKLSTDETVKLYVYEHIRENSHDLYGFTHIDTKRLFEQLLDVNGIGPKMALSVLGLGSVEDVRKAIASGDTKFIQAASGVGKRVAERLVVELKDKVGLVSTADTDALFAGTTIAQADEAVQALVSLGFTLPDAVTALNKVDVGLSNEERVKHALKEAS
jgi:Holliday junction DNA helicase RuvA